VLLIFLAATGCSTTRYSPVDVTDIRPGDRVRVHTRGGATTTGDVTAIDTTAVAIAGNDSTEQPLALGTVDYMERHVATVRHGGTGLAVGASLGFTLGVIMGLGAELNDGLEPLRGREPSGVNSGNYIAVGMLVGGLIGYAAGQGAATEIWQPVRSQRYRFRVERTPEGARAGVFSDF
jgi:hypothetical protein